MNTYRLEEGTECLIFAFIIDNPKTAGDIRKFSVSHFWTEM